jgi:ABC-2 type transport system permease protein
MRRLWALIRVEFLMEFGTPMTLVFFLGLPLLFTFAVGTGLQGMMAGTASPEELRIPIDVRLDDNGPLVDALLDTLAEVNLLPTFVDTLRDDAYGLVIPADFSERLLSGDTASLVLHTVPNSSAAPAVEQAVRAAQGRVGGAVLVARTGVAQAQAAGMLASADEESAVFGQVLAETLAATAHPPALVGVRWPADTAIVESRNMTTSIEQASAGQLVTWVQITLLGAAEVLVNDRLSGTLRRMLAVPAPRFVILAGKLLARLSLGLLQMTLLLVVGALVFGVSWGHNPLAVALVSFSFALATASLGILLATFIKTRGQASSVVVGMSMALAALGGAWFPLEVTPPLFRQIVQVLPSTWAMRAYTDLLVRRADVIAVLPYLAILGGFAILFMAVATLRFSRYQDS